MITWNGFDQAYIGAGYRCGCEPVAIYNYELMCAILVKRDGMTPDDAIEYIEFNMLNAWLGENTPLILINEPFDMIDSTDGKPKKEKRRRR